MTDHFDKWINGMSEQEYEDWLDSDATTAQEEKALNIRTPLTENEQEDMELAQEFDSTKQPREQLPEQRTRNRQPVRQEYIQDYEPSQPYIPPQPQPQVAYEVVDQPSPLPRKPTRIQRIRQALSNFRNRFRRNR